MEAQRHISRAWLLGSVFLSHSFVQIDSLHFMLKYNTLNYLLTAQHGPRYSLIKDCGKGILSAVEYNHLRGKKTTLSTEIKSSATKSALFSYQQHQPLRWNI